MDYGNLQLRSKSFLDFTTDPAILDEILGGHSEADKEEFLHIAIGEINPLAEQNRALTFMEFTDFCQDEQLVNAIKAEFGKQVESIFNE